MNHNNGDGSSEEEEERIQRDGGKLTRNGGPAATAALLTPNRNPSPDRCTVTISLEQCHESNEKIDEIVKVGSIENSQGNDHEDVEEKHAEEDENEKPLLQGN